MLKLLFWIVSFLFFTTLGYLIFVKLYKNKMTINRRITPLIVNQTALDQVENEQDEKNISLYNRFVKPSFEKLRTITVGKLPKSKIEQLEKKLHAAGRPFGISAGDYMLLQIILPVGIFLIFLLLFLPAGVKMSALLVYSSVVAFFVYYYMNYYLAAKMKQRIVEIDKAMPDFFDMFNVSLEAGLGLDGALKRVCNQMNSPLSDEFLSALEDMKLGKSRKQAFIELRDRVESEFFKSVMNSIIQADQMGIGMTKVLRTQTHRIREKQRFAAKEQAMKAPVKMLIPMVIFIFPTLFIVLLGPTIIDIINKFM